MTLEELVAYRIRRARRLMELTQSQAAELVGVSQNAWATYENGRRNVSLSILSKIARALDKPVTFFVDADYEEPASHAPIPKAESPAARAKKKKAA